jgi:ribosome-associated protein
LTSKEKALFAIDAALDKKALEPVLLEVTSQASYTDYILILSGNSDRHVQTIADSVVEAFARHRRQPIGSEGQREGQWALIDFGDLVVHVFYHPLRDFYDLEGLWCDAPRVELEIPVEARAGTMY